MPRRFFVTVIAPTKRALLNLQAYEMDLFQPTSKSVEHKGVKEFRIDGLLTLAEVERLVDGGYQVLVQEDSAKRARAHLEVAEFRDWLAGTLERPKE